MSDEIKELKEQISKKPIIILTGPSGVGKGTCASLCAGFTIVSLIGLLYQ